VITTLEEATAIAAEALAEEAPRWEVLAVRYGTRMTRRSEVYANYPELGEPDAPLRMDYYFWLLRSEASTILVDTGFAGDVGERRGRTTVCPPVDALARLGVTPDTVDLIVVTHMHYDHIGNLDAFPDTALLVPTRELSFWTGPGRTGEHTGPIESDEVDRVAAAVAAGKARLLEEGGIVAPGVGAVLVGGHSPGQIALVVRGTTGPVLLASDAVHYYEELERELPFEIYTDLNEMIAGYGLLRELATRTGAVLVPGHDPEVTERFPPVSDELAGVAVRLA
jgi:glyoxylase-like metal-dependent hydrolase (beta-lactamase superfamily II)